MPCAVEMDDGNLVPGTAAMMLIQEGWPVSFGQRAVLKGSRNSGATLSLDPPTTRTAFATRWDT